MVKLSFIRFVTFVSTFFARKGFSPFTLVIYEHILKAIYFVSPFTLPRSSLMIVPKFVQSLIKQVT